MKHLPSSLSCLLAALFSAVVPAVAQPTNSTGPRDFSAFKIINERNIFDPNRRPRVQQQTRVITQPKIVDSFSLVGTMSYSNVLLAFFDGSGADYRKSVAAGDKIGAYTAVEIHHNRVKLASGTNEIELKVGMQMRRSEDGSWAAALTPSPSTSSYASGDRPRGNDSRFSFGRSGQSPSGTPAAEAPPDAAGLDPNDPVARLMLRRMQEQGEVPARTEAPAHESQPEAPNGAPADQPMTETNQPVPTDTPENRNLTP